MRPYSVAPQLRPRAKSYTATYFVASGIKKVGSLRTQDSDTAQAIANGLVALKNCGAEHFLDARIPSHVPVQSRCIFFELETPETEVSPAPLTSPQVRADLAKFPAQAQQQAAVTLIERETARANLGAALTGAAGLQQQLDELKRQYDALKNSAVVKLSEAQRDMPTVAESLLKYESFLSSTTGRDSTNTHVSVAKRFAASLPADVRTLGNVRADHIAHFIDTETTAKDTGKPLSRRRNIHIRLARLINWAADVFGYPSQIKQIAFPSKSARRRERGEIVWHDLPECEAVIKGLQFEDPNETIYWQALAATLAYAGPQLAELIWLRNSDVNMAGASKSIWIGPVQDPTDPTVKHALKEGFRDRHVAIHKKYLQPRLEKYIAAGLQGEAYFFAKQTSRTRARKINGGHTERWIEDVLSTRLRGHKGGKKRCPTAGILPAGMNAATLRHTFGSLLVRSGKSTAEVAAAMGNSEEVVREHYARLLGSEVRINF